MGKTQVASNALRHGLNSPVLFDPALAPEVEALARGAHELVRLGVDQPEVDRWESARHPTR